MPLPPPSPYHPSGSFQCTSPEHPVSCLKPGLVIRFTYDIIHVSMPFCQIILPLPSPTESIRLFYTSVSLLLPRIQGYRYHLSKFHIYAFSSVQSLSRVRLFVTSWTVARQAPPSMGFPRQEYWSGLPFPSPAGFPYLPSFPGPGTLFRGKVSAARIPGVQEKGSSFPRFADQIPVESLRTNLQNIKFPGQILS